MIITIIANYESPEDQVPHGPKSYLWLQRRPYMHVGITGAPLSYGLGKGGLEGGREEGRETFLGLPIKVL